MWKSFKLTELRWSEWKRLEYIAENGYRFGDIIFNFSLLRLQGLSIFGDGEVVSVRKNPQGESTFWVMQKQPQYSEKEKKSSYICHRAGLFFVKIDFESPVR